MHSNKNVYFQNIDHRKLLVTINAQGCTNVNGLKDLDKQVSD